VPLQPGTGIAGRVVIDVDSPGAEVPSLDQLRLALRPASGQVSWIVGGSLRAMAPDADGGFDFGPVAPGLFHLEAAAGTADGWWPRSAMVAGRDVLDAGLAIALGDPDLSVVVTMTNRVSGVSGRLLTEAGAAAPEHTVILFPANHELWVAARRVRSTRPATDGRFSFADVPAGEYRMGAVVGGPPDGWTEPAFLAALEEASVAVAVTEGTSTVQDLRIQGGGNRQESRP
jgi:hypothetical protein